MGVSMSDHSTKFVRHQITRVLLRSNRINGGGQKEDDILRSQGYQNANEYWAEILSDEMEAKEFAALLYESQRVPHQNPPNFNDENLERRIKAKLRDAIQTPKDWLKRKQTSSGEKSDDLGHWRLDPLKATEWLLRLPLHRDLVPAGLRDFLEKPQEFSNEIRSGAPGRPSSVHLVKAEYERRYKAGTLEKETAAVARSLRSWLIHEYPSAPQLTEKSIKNKVPIWCREMHQRMDLRPIL